MTIATPADLQKILGQMSGLNDDDISNILDTAHFGVRGLDGIYAMPLLIKCSAEGVSKFLTAAGAYHHHYGGIRRGSRVHIDEYPTGRTDQPFVPRNCFFCWA